MVGASKPNLALEKGLKAGMEGLDKEKINKVMEEATKGSKFYAKKKADQARTAEQVWGGFEWILQDVVLLQTVC